MPRAIGRGGPGRLVGVGHLEQYRARFVAQANRAGVVGQTVRGIAEGTQDASQVVSVLNIGGHRRDGEETQRREDGVGGKREIHSAGQAKAADVGGSRLGVVDLDEFKILSVRAGQGVIHDFRNHQARSPTRRPQGLDSGAGGKTGYRQENG